MAKKKTKKNNGNKQDKMKVAAIAAVLKARLAAISPVEIRLVSFILNSPVIGLCL